MKQALENIFKPERTTTKFVTVVERVTSTKYEVADVSGNLMSVATDPLVFYPKGAEVIIQGGRIIGAGHRAGSHKTYEV